MTLHQSKKECCCECASPISDNSNTPTRGCSDCPCHTTNNGVQKEWIECENCGLLKTTIEAHRIICVKSEHRFITQTPPKEGGEGLPKQGSSDSVPPNSDIEDVVREFVRQSPRIENETEMTARLAALFQRFKEKTQEEERKKFRDLEMNSPEWKELLEDVRQETRTHIREALEKEMGGWSCGKCRKGGKTNQHTAVCVVISRAIEIVNKEV